MKNLPKLFKGFVKGREGSVAITTGLTFTMILGSVLASIEVEQIHRQRADMQSRLDAALLFLGGSPHKTDPQDAGEAFLNESIAQADLKVEDVEPVFTYDPVTGNVSGTVSFTPLGLVSSRILGDQPLNVQAVASPKIQGRVEIAMVLDTSGSMEWSFTSDNDASYPNRRIDGLHEAAEDMFNVIYQNPQAIPAVGVVPYAYSVDITDLFAGEQISDKLAGYEPFNTSGDLDDLGILSSLTGGLTGLSSSDSILDMTASSVTANDHDGGQVIWAAERYASQNADGSYVVKLGKPKSNQKIPVITQTDVNSSGSKEKYNGMGSSWWWKWTPRNGVLPMTLVGQDVRDYVADLEPSGGTAGHIGMAWGAYMLNRNWNRVFDHPAGKPAKWDETTEKYLVFMTDGVFNSAKDPDMDLDEQYAYFQAICSKIRDKGVRIFTVGLLVDDQTDSDGDGVPDSATDATWLAQKANTDAQLTQCAGDTGIYFPASSREELKDAFKGVGRETGELRISY